MAYGLSNGHVTDDLTWPWKIKLVTPIRLESAISRKLLELETSNLVCSLAGAQIINPESGRGLRHVTPTIFGSTVGYPSDSLDFCTFSSSLCRVSLLSCLIIKLSYGRPAVFYLYLDELLASLAVRCRICLLFSLYCILFNSWWQVNMKIWLIDWLGDPAAESEHFYRTWIIY